MHSRILNLKAINMEDPGWPDGVLSMGLRLGRTKTTDQRGDEVVFLSGRAAVAFSGLKAAVSRTTGPVFLRIDRWGKFYDTSISAISVNHVLKRLLAEMGLDPRDFSAHGVRAGYITSALKVGISAPEIMEQTLNRSLDKLPGYFKDEEQRNSCATRLL